MISAEETTIYADSANFRLFILKRKGHQLLDGRHIANELSVANAAVDALLIRQ